MSNAREIASGFGRRNAVINGKFDISQRGATRTGITGGVYTADRWSTRISTHGTWTYNQLVDAPAGTDFTSCAELLVTTADPVTGANDFATYFQTIEGFNFRPLYLKPLTLSFWVKSNVVGPYYVVFDNQAVGANNRSYVAPYTISVPNAWEYKTITIHELPVGGTWNFSNGVGLDIQWSLGQGTIYHVTTFNTWISGNAGADVGSDQVNVAATVGNYWRITGVQLEQGGIATEFEYRTFGEELELCQRYFEKSYAVDLPPGTITFFGATAIEGIGTETDHTYYFRTSKRATPTVTMYSAGTGAAGFGYDTTGPVDRSISPSSLGHGSFHTGYNVTVPFGNDTHVHWTADAEL